MILDYARWYWRWSKLGKIKNRSWGSSKLILMRSGRKMYSTFHLAKIKFCKSICIIRWNLRVLGFLAINIVNTLEIVDWIVMFEWMNRKDMLMKDQVFIKKVKEIQGLDIVINIMDIMNHMIRSLLSQGSRKVFQKKCTTCYKK